MVRNANSGVRLDGHYVSIHYAAWLPSYIVRPQIVTVVGRAFYDVDHSGKGQGNNRRSYDQSLAVWEIHPVAKIDNKDASLAATAQNEPEARLPSPASSSNVSPAPTASASAQFVTLIQPVKVKVRYGEMVLPRGMKLQILSRDSTSVRAEYMGEAQTIPLSATDIR